MTRAARRGRRGARGSSEWHNRNETPPVCTIDPPRAAWVPNGRLWTPRMSHGAELHRAKDEGRRRRSEAAASVTLALWPPTPGARCRPAPPPAGQRHHDPPVWQERGAVMAAPSTQQAHALEKGSHTPPPREAEGKHPWPKVTRNHQPHSASHSSVRAGRAWHDVQGCSGGECGPAAGDGSSAWPPSQPPSHLTCAAAAAAATGSGRHGRTSAGASSFRAPATATAAAVARHGATRTFGTPSCSRAVPPPQPLSRELLTTPWPAAPPQRPRRSRLPTPQPAKRRPCCCPTPPSRQRQRPPPGWRQRPQRRRGCGTARPAP